MRIAVLNLQSGVGVIKGYSEYLTKGWKYHLPHGDEMLQKSGAFLKEFQVDIAICVEVSETSLRSGFRSQLSVLSRTSGLTESHFFSLKNKDRLVNEGLVILSRFPIRETNTYPLTSGIINRILSEAVMDISGTKVHIFTTHLSLGSKIRKQQITEIATILKKSKAPFILGGDFNERDKKVFELFKEVELVHQCFAPTFPSWNPRHSLEALFLTKEFHVVSKSVPEQKYAFSDHQPLLADVTF